MITKQLLTGRVEGVISDIVLSKLSPVTLCRLFALYSTPDGHSEVFGEIFLVVCNYVRVRRKIEPVVELCTYM